MRKLISGSSPHKPNANDSAKGLTFLDDSEHLTVHINTVDI